MHFSIIYTIINSDQSLETAGAKGSLSLDGLQICIGVERRREVAGAQNPFQGAASCITVDSPRELSDPSLEPGTVGLWAWEDDSRLLCADQMDPEPSQRGHITGMREMEGCGPESQEMGEWASQPWLALKMEGGTEIKECSL